MSEIHPNAIIENGAQLDNDVQVGPFCHIGAKAKIGAGTKLKSHVVVHGRTTLGKNNQVWPFAVLGADPQDLKFNNEDSELVIGDNNDIRECATIHKGTAGDHNITSIGNNNLIMAYAHIGHDCIIDNHVIITNAVQLAGHIHLEDHVTIGGSSAAHHFVTVGKYAYVGGLTGVTCDIPPFMFAKGNPSRIRGINAIGLKRHGIDEQAQRSLKDAWRRLYKRSTEENGAGHSLETLKELERQYPDDSAIEYLVASLRRSSQGVYGRYREGLRRDNKNAAPVR